MNKIPLAIFISLVLLSIPGKTVYAQDPVFSQPYANPLYLNPAFAGTGNSQRIGLNFRDQWPSIPGNFVTYNASFDRNFIDSNNGVGLLINMDKSGSGTYTTDNFSLIYAHQFHINSFTISAGAQGTYLYKSIEESQLVFANSTIPVRGFVYSTGEQLNRTTVNIADFSAGILGYGKNLFFGFSADHLTQPDESFADGPSRLFIKYTLNAGARVPIGDITLLPTLIYEKQGDDFTQVAECYLNVGHITAGIGYRVQDAMIFMLGYQGKLFRIGYSYDYTISNLTNATGGTHEVSLAVLLPYKSSKLKKVTGINCPAF